MGDVTVADTSVGPSGPRPTNQRRTAQIAPEGRTPPGFAVAQAARSDCRFCKFQGHRTVQCPDFVALHVAARRRIAKARGWCFSCLGEHYQRDCPDTRPCPVCGGQHTKLLCANANGRRDHARSPTVGYVSGRRFEPRNLESGSPPPQRADYAAVDRQQGSARSPTDSNGSKMESEYDQKFEEMKKYIPFLDDMIKRLESSGLSSNPRQAQLDKLRSLRGLLLDKKKRLKMENLVKCEQVLINLHAKVEQRDLNSMTETENASSEKDKTHLKAVRNKLKSVVSKLNVQDNTGTLPEIARASKVEETCVQGSKEPALFQRRPNKAISVGSTNQPVSPVTETQQSKKNYTRVLHSPGADDDRCWSTSEKESNNVLFSRRSPRRHTPSYNKKERKKSKQIGKDADKHGETKDLNITLKLSEESLSSLNTKDMLSRIINCRDDDVDINTLRELRSQILGELKDTGLKDDISDIILKSYKKKNKEKYDMEDGELSDSESDVIQNVYSSVVVMDKDKNTMNLVSKTSNDEAPRKIKICLVINSEQVKSNISKENIDLNNPIKVDITDFENYQNDKHNDCIENENSNVINEQKISNAKNNDENVSTKLNSPGKSPVNEDSNVFVDTANTNETKTKTDINSQSNEITKQEINDNKLMISKVESGKDNVICITKPPCLLENTTILETNNQIKKSDITLDKNVKIPLLNLEETVNKEVASEIDILQALKKEIFNETSTVLNTDAETPPLHQPKTSKVIHSNEIGNKKRISIENYKAKSTNIVPHNTSPKVDSVGKDDLCRKQSLKLTEKECERFNFMSKLSIDDSSDEEDKSSLSLNDIYGNFAPKSPDHNDFADTGLKPPIIIPNDPVDEAISTTESDIDMRKSLPVPNTEAIISNLLLTPKRNDPSIGHINGDIECYSVTNKEKSIPLTDPRLKRDVNLDMNVDTSDPITMNTDIMSRQISSYGGSSTPQSNSNIAPFLQSIAAPVMVTPALVSNVSATVPNVIPNMALGIPLTMTSLAPLMPCLGNMTPIMTPNARTYEMTPCRSMENEDFTQDHHIYTPLFSSFDEHETENSIVKQRHECNRKEKNIPYEDIGRHTGNYHPEWDDTKKNIDKRIPVWEDNVKNIENYHTARNDPRKNIDKRIPVWEDSRIMNNFSYRENNMDSYQQNYKDRYRYDNRESYNRPECPQTPVHSFGRLDCPSTPTPPLGRSDLPMAHVYSFDRSDLQRSTSRYGAHSDPRRFIDSDYNNKDDDKERRYFNDRNFNTHSYRSIQSNRSTNKSDFSRQYRREQSMGRYDRKSQYRDSSVGRPYDIDYEHDKFCYNKNSREKRESDYHHEKNLKNNSDYYRREYRNYEVEKKNTGHLSLNRSTSMSASDTSEKKYGEPFTFDESRRKTLKNHDAGEHKKDNFDTRRLRAASVGRTLVRDNITHDIESRFELDKKIITNSIECKRDRFRRAASVGKELESVTKNFRDVKEDLKSFKIISDSKSAYKVSQYKENRKAVKVASSRDLLTTKHDSESKKSSSTCYSPKENKRDPRQRDAKHRDCNTRNDGRKSRWDDTKNYGIVYSSDNISKGKILGSGYGVKNYKIPKIKRTSIDTEISEATEKTKDSTSNDGTISTKLAKDSLDDLNKNTINAEKSIRETSKICNVEEQNAKIPSKNEKIAVDVEETVSNSDSSEASTKKDKFKYKLSEDSNDNFEKRVTRSAKKKLLNNEDKSFRKTRKIRKIYLSDSDSDESNTATEKVHKPEIPIDNMRLKLKRIENEENVLEETKIESEKDETNMLDSQDSEAKDFDYLTNNTYFGLQKNSDFAADDLEGFNENVISDPVIDNINELIADLDQDLDASKNITNEVSENLQSSIEPNNDTEIHKISKMVLISSPSRNNDLQNTVSEMNETVSVELVTSSKNFSNIQKSESVPILGMEKIEYKSTQNVSKISKEKNEDSDIIKDCQVFTANNTIKPCNEQSVQNETVVPKIGLKSNAVFENSVLLSTDKTENMNKDSSDKSNKEVLPEKVGESLFENNMHKASTGDSTNYIRENQEPPKSEMPKEIDSIHKLFSLLQDKSKMMELISKLSSDSVENEKIKKKLEKLSEIVSDDEDDTQQEGGVAIFDNKGTKDNNNEKTEDKLIKQNSEPTGKEKTTLPVKETENTVINVIGDTDHLPKPVNFLDNNYVKANEMTKKEEIENKIDSVNEMEMQNKENEKLSQNLKELQLDKNTLDLNINTNISKLNSDNILSGNVQKVDESLNSQSEKDLNSLKNRKPKKKKYIRKRRAKNKKKTAITQKKTTLKNLQPKENKSSRELKNLLLNIDEFIKDDDLNSPGIRTCRLLKIINEEVNEKDDSQINDKAFMVGKKSNNDTVENIQNEYTNKKVFQEKDKLIDNSCNVALESKIIKQNLSTRPGPKSKTRPTLQDSDLDPYVFETDSVNESNASKNESDSESENELQFSKAQNSDQMFTEDTTETKIRSIQGGVQAGLIKPKNKRNRTVSSDAQGSPDIVKIPDIKCFTDKSYCFKPNTSMYSCRLCNYTGSDIVPHYIKHHRHSEIPLSRLSPGAAQKAIKQCELVNFQAISKMPTDKYTCRFCYKDFVKKELEDFFWHVVSMHTGEYVPPISDLHKCSECLDTAKCPFSIDIPPPPGYVKGQLLGYICGKCNFTQVSVENLKTHVIKRHNDEETEVYTISLSLLSKKAILNYLKELETQNSTIQAEEPRKLRNTQSKQNVTECSNDDIRTNEKSKSPLESVRNIQSKLTFEGDNLAEISYSKLTTTDTAHETRIDTSDSNVLYKDEEINNPEEMQIKGDQVPSSDIFSYPHFKIQYTTNGLKEYVCCINGNDNHYKTTLFISMKRHIQLKHSENWDGYCFLCKVIVTPQGTHQFKDCLHHYFDKHIDDFPIVNNVVADREFEHDQVIEGTKETERIDDPVKTGYIEPLSQIISTHDESQNLDESNPGMPVIESVKSLRTTDQSLPSPSYPNSGTPEAAVEYKYEEAQADIMSKKHCVVLDTMMSHVNLVQIFKCAGKFCSFTTDSAEEALLHSSTHVRIGGEYALCCVYCNYDASGNAIDLVTHVFKNHGCCPYVCGVCFYRAAASQLVQAHINRVHPDISAQVLRTTVVKGTTEDENCLPRKIAVPFYVCKGDHDTQNPCKFRTYTPSKFFEHMQQRHQNSKEFLCFICSEASSSPSDLIRHLKTHGLKLYQCTWCVYGADSETELLKHSSAKHPSKQPKAFLRIITKKQGSDELKVLPLVHLNKNDITVLDIQPNVYSKNPVREAERAIELEKLIGETTSMVEATSNSIDSNTDITASITKETKKPSDLAPQLASLLIHPPISSPIVTATLLNKRLSPGPSAIEAPVTTIESNWAVPFDIPTPDAVCLGSDDENFINISEESSSSTAPIAANKTFNIEWLYKCAKCNIIFENPQKLTAHFLFCSGTNKTVLCAHCNAEIYKNQIVKHYKAHSRSYPFYGFICPMCNLRFETVASAEEHFKKIHSKVQTNVIWIAQQFSENAISKSLFQTNKKIITQTNKIQETRPKRKRSLESKNKTIEPPEKLKKYGPQDIDKLPINPILDDFVHCSLCDFSTKVRLNMVRHLQLHAQQQPVPETAPINPVPHLESNEKHFDKMLNLASSSIVNRTLDKTNKNDPSLSVTFRVAPEDAGRYPKYVPHRQRYTCGAKGCSYISVDEKMLKCHWETLHSGTNDYHCVHCPQFQQLDTSKPLNALRIIGHLKMHDVSLYACSLCSYYHYMRQILEKHLNKVHKSGQVLIVREENSSLLASTSQTVTTPTMDLKAWHCGLCQFKSLLRPEVVEHCAKLHNSKMQFKCGYCAFRTSSLENIPKHQSKSHEGKQEDIFYYYYREGSIPDDADGTPCWVRQKQKVEASDSKIKSESIDPSYSPPSPPQPVVLPEPVPVVDLNLVKKEIIEPEDHVDDFCQEYGELCEPNGLKYKCPLCNNVTEDDEESMQSHLYEELKYRKWGCSVCSYKAFHYVGFREHMQTEHAQQQNREPLELPVDSRVETWVTKLLKYQKMIIEKNKENFAKQKAEIKRVNQSLVSESREIIDTPVQTSPAYKQKFGKEAGSIFGTFGEPSGELYCCPICYVTFNEANDMQTHLESELNNIRWFCSSCPETFQNYHEAQFHCKSVHPGYTSRPIEVARDASLLQLRSTWVESVMQSQTAKIIKVRDSVSNTLQDGSTSDQNENSLLVVRYEQQVTTPEEEMASRSLVPKVSDDEQSQDKLSVKYGSLKKCPYCSYVKAQEKILNNHILQHYNLKAYSCPYCGLDGNRKQVIKHQRICHPTMSTQIIDTVIPRETPEKYLEKKYEDTDKICLICRKTFSRLEASAHHHGNLTPDFAKNGDIVVKCCVCSMLYKELYVQVIHHNLCHPKEECNYVFCKLITDAEGNCTDIVTTIELDEHTSKSLQIDEDGPSTSRNEDAGQNSGVKRKGSDDVLPSRKKVARKSTSK